MPKINNGSTRVDANQRITCAWTLSSGGLAHYVMAPARLSRSASRLLAFVLACMLAFANVALAAKACPVAGGCPTGADAIASEPGHHEDAPCTMAATKAESTSAVAAFADIVKVFAVPALPALAVALPADPAAHAIRPADVPRRDVLDVFGRLRL